MDKWVAALLSRLRPLSMCRSRMMFSAGRNDDITGSLDESYHLPKKKIERKKETSCSHGLAVELTWLELVDGLAWSLSTLYYSWFLSKLLTFHVKLPWQTGVFIFYLFIYYNNFFWKEKEEYNNRKARVIILHPFQIISFFDFFTPNLIAGLSKQFVKSIISFIVACFIDKGRS